MIMFRYPAGAIELFDDPVETLGPYVQHPFGQGHEIVAHQSGWCWRDGRLGQVGVNCGFVEVGQPSSDPARFVLREQQAEAFPNRPGGADLSGRVGADLSGWVGGVEPVGLAVSSIAVSRRHACLPERWSAPASSSLRFTHSGYFLRPRRPICSRVTRCPLGNHGISERD